jgi:hypothetical protein
MGALESRQRHLDNDCEYAVVKCSHEGCSHKVQRRYLGQHLKDCDYLEVPCDYCGECVVIVDMDEHLIDCDSVPVPCPNRCKDVLVRGNLTQHEQVCSKAIVPCPFATMGCDHGHITRETLSSHMEEFQQRHVTVMGQTLLAQQRLISTQIEQISDLTARLRDADQGQSRLNNQVSGVMTRLSTGQARISWIIRNFISSQVAAAGLFSKPITIMVPKVGSCVVKLRLKLKENDVSFGICGDNLPSKVCLDGTSLRILKSAGTLFKEFSLSNTIAIGGNQGLGQNKFASKEGLLGHCLWRDGSVHIEANIVLSEVESNGVERVVIY